TPIQHWFFEQNLSHKSHYNQATLLQAQRPLDPSLLNQLFSLLLSHHDALRFRYHQDTQCHWIQTSLDHGEPFSLHETNLSPILSEDQLAQAIEERASHIQQSLDIEKGPVIQAVLFDCGQSRPQRLLIVIHHLMVDGVSWRILLEDIETVYDQLAQGDPPSLPSKTHSYQQWANALREHASSQSLLEEIPYWQQISNSIKLVPVDFNLGLSETLSQTITHSLSQEKTTNLLKEVHHAYDTHINDILLAALVLGIGDWTQKYEVSLLLEGHGREDIINDIDLSRTVGWFTTLFPVHLNIENSDDLEEAIKMVKRTLRKIPHKGIGFGILSYLTHPRLNLSIKPSIRFNYLGQWDNAFQADSLFTFANESSGSTISAKNALPYLLDFNGHIKNGRIQISLTYSKNHYSKDSIERILEAYMFRLTELIDFCLHQKDTSSNKLVVPFYNKGNNPIIFFIHPI
ncbi:MAG: non-ribosomal peptide synthetase, partial [Alphaproteobacteria bacterium]|nr:non-ribosomal peptide synthetase [Alphaproteobacteria bacterium]